MLLSDTNFLMSDVLVLWSVMEEISVGTALRAFDLSVDQTFVFELLFRSGNPVISLLRILYDGFPYRPCHEYQLPTKKEEDFNQALATRSLS